MSWYLKQLLPFRYNTKYRDVMGRQWNVRWRMWFGRSFLIRTKLVKDV